MRVYLDACALSRLTDDQSQPRIHAEAEAVEQVLRLVSLGHLEWVASVALRMELSRNPDSGRRHDALALLSYAGAFAALSSAAIVRASNLETLGCGTFDALHLACAEEAGADALLTTDDRFIRQAARLAGGSVVVVANPVDWLHEVRRWLP